MLLGWEGRPESFNQIIAENVDMHTSTQVIFHEIHAWKY